MQTLKLGQIKKYAATWTKEGKFKSINTDNLELAEKKAYLNPNGQVWINTRYEAAKRLRRIYVNNFFKKTYDPAKVDYPNLLTVKN